jgi:drug efflux transport system permease protein
MALMRKESAQMLRDPSTFLIALALPLVLLFLFGYGVSLDATSVRIGLALESSAPPASSLAASFLASPFFHVTTARDRRELEPELVGGRIKALIVIPDVFAERIARPGAVPEIQLVTDGAEPNTASLVRNYVQGVLANWQQQQQGAVAPAITVETRFWFNPELKSRNFLVPGTIAIVMTLIGTLLTALVISREWERGTMEALLATPVSALEILAGKLIPYFLLGLGSMAVATALAVWLFGVPLRGSFFALTVLTAAFLCPALGQGLLISAVAKNQFVASQIALLAGFMPAFLLSGFIFEIDSMPKIIQVISALLPARYFIASLQSVFLAGDLWGPMLKDIGILMLLGAVFLGLAMRATRKRL